jgi:biopolymer transport protein ExbB/TolQ
MMKTWEYTPNVTGSFYVTVAVPSPNERGAGKLANISVDLTNLRLPENVTISLARKDAGRVVAQTGFFDQVSVTGAPAKVQDLYKDNIGKTLGAVFVNLGPFFQLLFIITAVAWVFCFVLAVKQVRQKWEPEAKVVKKFRFIPVGNTMFESPLVKQVEDMWMRSIRNTQLNAEFFAENKLTLKDINRIRTKLAEADTAEGIKMALNEAHFTEMIGDRIFYKGSDEQEVEDVDEVKGSVKERLKGLRELAPEDTKKKVDDVLADLDQCFDLTAIRDLINRHGFSADSMVRSTASKGAEKSPEELLSEVTRILNKLEEMQTTLSLNGNSNGQAQLSGLELEAKEKEYEQFLWRYFGEPLINEALEICEKNRNAPLCQIFESGLRNHKINRNNWWASQEIDRSVDRTAAVKFEERRGVLDWLWAIGSLSPMFGLGGTVWGISQAFGKIKGVTDTRLLMQKLAGDINIALSTTIVGLVLGVLAFLTYYYTKYFLDQQAANIEKYFTEITNEA